MPCVSLHTIVHLLPDDLQSARFPAVHTIITSPAGSPEHYSLPAMALYASIPYAVWQLSYHFLITVRRREKIAAGRPTSFTWLRRSYSKKWIGKLVISLPDKLQEPAFMMIQYVYALLTMLPCPLWFWYRWASATFLMAVFCWSVYNGATYYIDVFGNRFQKEMEAMKKEVQKWQNSPDMGAGGMDTPGEASSEAAEQMDGLKEEVDKIPLLQEERGATGIDGGAKDVAKERTIGQLPA
jgi:hypothetical protein